jgi:beta-carotene 3-hydroxylase
MKALLEVLLNLLLVVALAVFMEWVAWFTHKYVMHGFLWVLHADHHRPTGRGWQKNDLFALFFASISMALIIGGLRTHQMSVASAGIGVALYGVGYFLFHDLMFHRRIRWIHLRPRGRYLERIVRAHRDHHQHTSGRTGGVSFGFLYAPRRYDRSG